MNTQEKTFAFSAVDLVGEKLIEAPTEKCNYGRDWVSWGERNTFPFYLKSLFKTAPTLRSVILGAVDYVCGNAVNATHGLVGRDEKAFDRHGSTARELVKNTAQSIFECGGFAWKITLNRDLQNVGEIEVLPYQRIRTDEDNQIFYYSEKWEKGSRECVVYPRWQADTQVAESVFFVKVWGDGVYPEPVYLASVESAETERGIKAFHLGEINRGFMGSYIVNFNNGQIPTDTEKKQIEREFSRKFAGAKNAGRIMFSWNRNKDGMTTLQKMEVADYGEKYASLEKSSRQSIFTAFRANPNLFGLATESSGFNSEEYEQSFKLFNRTMIQPIQAVICDSFRKVLREDIISIEPFTLDGADKTVDADGSNNNNIGEQE